jgi:hypothetical protein
MDIPWNNDIEGLEYLKSRYPLYHLSNVFFRDIQFGLQGMMEERGRKLGYAGAEELTRAFITRLEQQQILQRVDAQTWVLHYEKFRKPMTKPAAPEKPVPAARPAAAPAPPAAPVTGS